MNQENRYDILVIGGGISACVFVSNYIKQNPNLKMAIVEAGRSLGGRCSTRNSRKFKDWRLNHGSPGFNIRNSNKRVIVKNFINELLDNNLVKDDDSDFIELCCDSKLSDINKSDFYSGSNYKSLSSMTDLSKDIIALNNFRNQIDFYFETLIIDLKFSQNQWTIKSKNGDIFKSKYLVFSSNLLLHKRSMEIFNFKIIPLRKAIPKNKNKNIDLLLEILDKQLYIPRLTFLIYLKANYSYKDNYRKDYRYFNLSKELEKKYKFERVIFQLQKNNCLGIVIHSKNKDLITDYLKAKNVEVFKRKIKLIFNELFKNNSLINQLSNYEDISIMRWRASQPIGVAVPLSLQYCHEYNLGFCGDWFENEGFGRIEGAILSSLELTKKISSQN